MGTEVLVPLIIAVLVLPWLYVLIFLLVRNRTLLKNYIKLSDKYGLTINTDAKKGLTSRPFTKGNFRGYGIIVGTYDDRENKLNTIIKLNSGNTDHFSFVLLPASGSNNNLAANEKMLSEDNEFDSKFILSANNPARMINLLNFSIKNKLLQSENIGFKGELKLGDGTLSYSEKGLIIDDRGLLRIELIMHTLCEIADELKTSSGLNDALI
jgi:hypothetical protein